MNASSATPHFLNVETDDAEAAALEIELIEDFGALRLIAAEWRDLLASSAADCIFLTWEWVDLWWQTYGGSFELFVLTARRRGRLVGIAPLKIERPRYCGISGPRFLMMIGQGGGTLAERFAIIAAPGDESEVTETFVQALCGPHGGRWDALRFERLLEDSLPTRVLIEALSARGFELGRTHTRTAAFATLPDSMDAYLKSRSSNFRSQYRGSVRKIDALGDVRLRLAGRDIAVADAMLILGRLHRARFDAEGSESFRDNDYLTFHGRLAELLASQGRLWLAILEADGKPVAARYDYVYGGKVWCMQGGWDPELAGLRPGMVVTGAVFEWAIENGLAEYDFLCGGESYKARWATGERVLIGFRAFNRRTLKGRAMQMLFGLRQMLRPSARRSGESPEP